MWASCPACYEKRNKPYKDDGLSIRMNIRPFLTGIGFADELSYEDVPCTNGHQIKIFLTNQKFEVLFQGGTFAIFDGYYREAVASFSSALECLYLFAIELILYKKGIDREQIEKTLKAISLSERRLGAFLALYLIEAGVKLSTLENEKVRSGYNKDAKKFRNDVIHNGKIPTKQQTLEYGNIVLRHIREVCGWFNISEYQSITEEILELKIEKDCSENKTKGKLVNTIVSVGGSNNDTLETIVENIDKQSIFFNDKENSH